LPSASPGYLRRQPRASGHRDRRHQRQLSLIGLELCSQIGARIGERGDLGGLVLIGIGVAVARGIV
jgi:hypothetical protein